MKKHPEPLYCNAAGSPITQFAFNWQPINLWHHEQKQLTRGNLQQLHKWQLVPIPPYTAPFLQFTQKILHENFIHEFLWATIENQSRVF